MCNENILRQQPILPKLMAATESCPPSAFWHSATYLFHEQLASARQLMQMHPRNFNIRFTKSQQSAVALLQSGQTERHWQIFVSFDNFGVESLPARSRHSFEGAAPQAWRWTSNFTNFTSSTSNRTNPRDDHLGNGGRLSKSQLRHGFGGLKVVKAPINLLIALVGMVLPVLCVPGQPCLFESESRQQPDFLISIVFTWESWESDKYHGPCPPHQTSDQNTSDSGNQKQIATLLEGFHTLERKLGLSCRLEAQSVGHTYADCWIKCHHLWDHLD